MKEEERFTSQLKSSSGEKWDQIINHRFTIELAQGSIDRKILQKYLIQDHRFLDAFTILLSSAISHTRSLSDRIPLCQFLAVITSDENTYFERSFEILNVSIQDRQSIPDASVTTRFIQLMMKVARGHVLADMLAVLVVCEWTYLSWGTLVSPFTKREDDDDAGFVTYEWVDLHSGPYFTSVVEWLRTLLDKEVEFMTKEEKLNCQSIFLETVKLELEFFDYAFDTK